MNEPAEITLECYFRSGSLSAAFKTANFIDERYGQRHFANEPRKVGRMEVPESFYPLVENTCRELYIRSLKEIPPDVVAAIKKAAAGETKEVAKRIFSHYIQSIELGQTKDMIVCQDTGIPIYWVDIGGNLRIDGARLTEAFTRGTERATKEHPLRSSIVSPLKRENRQTSTGHRIPIIHYDFVAGSDDLDILFMPKRSGERRV